LDIVDEAEVVDVHRNFGVVDFLERVDHGFVAIAADRAGIGRRGLGGEEALQIVALALELRAHRFWRGLDILDARLRRRRDAFHFLDPNSVLAHPKILSTRARPSISAATSSSLLYTPKLARAVAGTPRCSISGCAQWCPARIATPLSSKIVPMSCGCTPAIAKLTIPALFSGPKSVMLFLRASASRSVPTSVHSCAWIASIPIAST